MGGYRRNAWVVIAEIRSKHEKANRPIRFGCPCRYGRHLCRCFTIAGRLQLCLPGFRVRRALSLSYLNVLPRLETVVQVPIMEGVPHLIENDSRISITVSMLVCECP